MFMDSYLYAAGAITGSIFVGIIVLTSIRFAMPAYVYAYIYLGGGLIAGLLALWATLKMRSVYESSLLNWRLQRRKRVKSVLDELSF